MLDRPAERKAELALRFEPGRIERVAGAGEVIQDLEEIAPDEVLEHKTIVQGRAPAHWLAVERRAPKGGDERAEQQLLRQAHARVQRHLEGAEFHKAKPSGRAVG